MNKPLRWQMLLLISLLITACTPGSLPMSSVPTASTPTPFVLAIEAPDIAVTPVMATTTLAANLYTGPARYYEAAGSLPPGQPVEVVGRNERGDWYQLRDGRWLGSLAVRGGVNVPVTTQVSGRIVAEVLEVLDGDTLLVEYDSRTYEVRYLISNAPQAEQAFGREAYEQNLALTDGETVLLEIDTTERDVYQRLLRYVYRASDNLLINEEMVRSGFAQVVIFEPDVRYEERLRSAQAEAQSTNRGLWADATAPLIETEAGCLYIVKPGETFFIIAKRFGLSIESFTAANKIEDINLMRDGTELMLPGCRGEKE